ncbi:MAG: class I SAM-dependent methyltransferase [Thermoplasmata archaeon]
MNPGPDTATTDLGRVPDRGLVRDLFAWLAPRYDAAVATYSWGQDLRWKHTLLRRLGPRPGQRALDLACGTGLISERLGRVLGAGSVIGLDMNRDMLEHSRRPVADRRSVLADSESLPFRSQSFDLVTAGYLFKYVHLDRLCAEIRRVLRPGGRFGGYDFSRPLVHTPAGWLYAQYLGHLLPWLGRRRDQEGDDWERLLSFLSDIAPRSGWEDRVGRALGDAGFDHVELVPSLGGAITWVWARAA